MPPAPSAAPRRVSRARLRAYHRLSLFLTPSPDGPCVAHESANGNLTLIADVESRRARQATAVRRAVRSASWSPDDRTIVIAADRDGDEATRLFRLDAAGGGPEPLLTVAGVRFELGEEVFSRDGAVVVFAASDRDAAQFDLCEVARVDRGVRWLGLARCLNRRADLD